MDKDTRNAIERATQRARKLLEEDFAAQLEGDFDVQGNGTVAPRAGAHLSSGQAFRRDRIVAAIEHKRAAGMGPADAVADYLRDAAFTALNRFVALKMLEARELVQECITKGERSAGYREFGGMAPGVPLLPDNAGYRLYLESLFDELSTEVKVLFDRRDPSSVLWPKRATFEQLLEILNAIELAGVWGEDETIGWVYQFFNGQDERRKMRDASQAPRNSRELAVRNQFFTPRYVVQFLTDNTLGRIWYEMRGTETGLVDKCEYMVRKPGEAFAPRSKKDPRDLRVLDPACGSGHFLLYAFDLLVAIYEEAHADADGPRSEATGKTLAEDYPSLDALRKATPGLILAHNLHGVDIDARCAQIAQLALWMRAQRAYRDAGIGRAERAQIRRSNVVVAEPLVADEQIAKEFVARLGDVELGRVFMSLVEALSLAGDMGLLLRLEQLVKPSKRQGELFAPPEERIRAALERFVREEGGRASTRRRLFAEDAVQGMGLLGIAEKKFDVVLMNPPFGTPSETSKECVRRDYPIAWENLLCAMIVRSLELVENGSIGALLDSTWSVKKDYEEFRRHVVLPHRVFAHAHLGWGVLDANVEVAATVIFKQGSGNASGDEVVFAVDAQRAIAPLDRGLRELCTGVDRPVTAFLPLRVLRNAPNAVVLHSCSSVVWTMLEKSLHLPDALGRAYIGMKPADNFRFIRLHWEVSPSDIGKERKWIHCQNGSPYAPFSYPCFWVSRVSERFRHLDGLSSARTSNSEHYFKGGLTYGKRTSTMYAYTMPKDQVFTNEGQAIIPLSDDKSWTLLAYINSASAQEFVGQFSGQHKESGYVNILPVPDFLPTRLGDAARQAVLCLQEVEARLEQSLLFSSPVLGADISFWEIPLLRISSTVNLHHHNIDVAVAEALGIEHSCSRDLDYESLIFGPGRGQCYAIEEVSQAIGVAFGRIDVRATCGGASRIEQRNPWDPLPAVAPAILLTPSGCSETPVSKTYPLPLPLDGVLVDDAGHERDIDMSIRRVFDTVYGGDSNARWSRVLALLDSAADELRGWIARSFFDIHLKHYSRSRRRAPIYWQLATPSASYSVWLYIHAFTKDTLFRVQNDYTAPKLAHEERRLESMLLQTRDHPAGLRVGQSVVGGGATIGLQRKHIAAQESLVEELRTFLDEVKRVAPLWNPNLDDGVILNFAPLWRLVPQHKPWQKELKSTWDSLCEGTYDWAHLAMHLWPERVVPKCAEDRSLAIAHGLEDVFWLEGNDGKWTARKTPTRSVDELVRERTSPAVKAALKSLLEAPAAPGASRRNTRRKKEA
jgi:hypothetical protein